MTITEYLNKLDDICNNEFISITELVRDLGVAYNTIIRIRRNPDTCSMKTRRKIKKFVDAYEAKNMSVIN